MPIKFRIFAFCLGLAVTAAHAEVAAPGIQLYRSEDGQSRLAAGGGVLLDYTDIQRDKDSGFDSGAGPGVSRFYFRRAFVSAAGDWHSWRFHVDEDIANTHLPGNGVMDA